MTTTFDSTLLADIIDAMPIAIYSKDPALGYRYVIWNMECEKLTGITADQALGKTDFELWPREVAEKLRATDVEIVTTGKPVFVPEWRVPNPKFEYWGRIWKIPLAASDGRILMIGMCQDISQEKRLVRETTDQEKKLKRITSKAPCVFLQFKMAPDGIITFPFVSHQAYEMFGMSREDAMANPKAFLDRILDEDRPSFERALAASVEGRSRLIWEGRYRDMSGKIRWAKGLADPALADDGTLVWDGVAIETSAAREAEERIRKQNLLIQNSSRLVALGEMAGAIAHEINTPLSALLMASEQVTEACEPDNRSVEAFDEIKELSEIMHSTTGQVAKIVSSLRRFARDGSSDPKEQTDPVSIIENVLNMSRERFSHNGISLTFDSPDVPVTVRCRCVEIGQVLLNLLNNSFDAVVGSPNPWVAVSIAEGECDVQIQISDSGGGIPDKIADRLFEPFFTTKDPGRGTGLGLSVSHSIIERHGGKLVLDREARNTTFRIVLPKN